VNGSAELVSCTDISAATGMSNTAVQRIASHASLRQGANRARRSIPAALADLLTVAIRSRVLTLQTARMLGSDPAAVLEGAQALAEIARRRLAEQDDARVTAA
jgi:hypothetical protein